MIDIHCHVLFDADDGAQNIDTSIEMCRIASDDGVEAIIATPHFIVGENNEKNILEKVNQLNEGLKEKEIDIKIYPGNEIFVDYNMQDNLSQGECFSLNNSRYVLVEFPMIEIPKFSSDALYELQIKGCVPVIAHPERNRAFQDKFDHLYELVSSGCLVQMNSSSITGVHGDIVKKTALTFLRHNLVHFIASDAHSAGRRGPMLTPSRRIVEAIIDEAAVNDLYYNNPKKVIKNEHIEIKEPIPLKKKRLFQKLFSRNR